MKFVADLHLHSAYARATSKSLNFDTLSSWAKWKGIGLLSSADFTHPVWFKESKSKLKELGNGLYYYDNVKYILGTEISCIYTQGGKQRRIHCLLYFPDLADVEKFNDQLGKRANLAADGRPIVGLSAKELLELALNVNEKAIFIPAHAWTPWFSLYGSNSGFDSIEECFGDLSGYIYAVETGLSSDPAMNWRIRDLDRRSIVSFSDAHSAPKMGRELTVLDAHFSYEGLLMALKSAAKDLVSSNTVHQTRTPTSSETHRVSADRQVTSQDRKDAALAQTGDETVSSRDVAPLNETSDSRVAFTVEFFPEEGKYHFTGHRNCGIRQSPEETDKMGIICPKCSRRLTVGVMHRVAALAEKDRPEGFKAQGRPPFFSLVPLQEILAEALGLSVLGEKIRNEYINLVNYFGNEMNVLLKARVEEIEKATSNFRVAEGVDKVRKGEISIEPGFDGVYGTVKIWSGSTGEVKNPRQVRKVEKIKGQISLFD